MRHDIHVKLITDDAFNRENLLSADGYLTNASNLGRVVSQLQK